LDFLFGDINGPRATGVGQAQHKAALGLLLDAHEVRKTLWEGPGARQDGIKLLFAPDLFSKLFAYIVNNAMGRPILYHPDRLHYNHEILSFECYNTSQTTQRFPDGSNERYRLTHHGR
jgi:hypothetical protein